MMILQLSYIWHSEESGFITCPVVSVCRVDNSCPFIKTCSFIFNSCQVRTTLQYDLSLMAAKLDFRQSEGYQGSDSVLFEFLSVENMGLDTKRKFLPCLPRMILQIL